MSNKTKNAEIKMAAIDHDALTKLIDPNSGFGTTYKYKPANVIAFMLHKFSGNELRNHIVARFGSQCLNLDLKSLDDRYTLLECIESAMEYQFDSVNQKYVMAPHGMCAIRYAIIKNGLSYKDTPPKKRTPVEEVLIKKIRITKMTSNDTFIGEEQYNIEHELDISPFTTDEIEMAALIKEKIESIHAELEGLNNKKPATIKR